jgi:hypothetical protein
MTHMCGGYQFRASIAYHSLRSYIWLAFSCTHPELRYHPKRLINNPLQNNSVRLSKKKIKKKKKKKVYRCDVLRVYLSPMPGAQ